MRSSSINSMLSLVFLLTATVAATDYLTIIEPCPACPSSVKPPPITVTEQLQTVSTCNPTTTCKTTTENHQTSSTCSALYPYSEYVWVSTILPLPWGQGSCTVTNTDQSVTVNEVTTSVTHYTTITPSPNVHKLYSNHTVTTTAPPYTKVVSVDIIVYDYICPFKSIGPHAIPGYPGSGLCVECEPRADGSAIQVVDVHKCINHQCVDYLETWEWSPPKPTTSVNVRPCTTSQVASTPGTYTITVIPETCSTTTVSSGPTTITFPETTIVCPSNGVYTATVTPQVCTTTFISPPHGQPTTVYITTTITKTFTFTTTECNTHNPFTTQSTHGTQTTHNTHFTNTTHTTHSMHTTQQPSTTTTSHSTRTHTSSQPVNSQDVESEDENWHKERELQEREVKARALEYRELPKNVVRRGGVLRSKRSTEDEKAAARKKRDFSIAKNGLL